MKYFQKTYPNFLKWGFLNSLCHNKSSFIFGQKLMIRFSMKNYCQKFIIENYFNLFCVTLIKFQTIFFSRFQNIIIKLCQSSKQFINHKTLFDGTSISLNFKLNLFSNYHGLRCIWWETQFS